MQRERLERWLEICNVQYAKRERLMESIRQKGNAPNNDGFCHAEISEIGRLSTVHLPGHIPEECNLSLVRKKLMLMLGVDDATQSD